MAGEGYGKEKQKMRDRKQTQFLLIIAALVMAAAIFAGSPAAADYLVLSFGTDRVLRFGDDGTYKGVFAGPDQNITKPTAIARRSDGKIYVACYVTQITSYIVRLSEKGEYEAHVGTGDYGFIGGLIFDQAGNLYISDSSAWWVNKLTPDGVQTVLNSGSETTPSPAGMAFDAQGRLYLACGGANGKILRWNADGSFDRKLLDNPRLVDVAIVTLDGGAQAVRALRADGSTSGYYLGWDIEGNWTGPYVTTESSPEWVNSLWQIDATKFLIVGYNGIYRYELTDQGPVKTLWTGLIPGLLSSPYGIVWVPDEVGSANSLNYQGRLADSSGNPVPDGQHTLIFAFFATETGGDPLWTSAPVSATTSGGLFTTTIPGVPPAVFDAKDVWLQVTVNGETLSPRIYVSSVPLAMKALRAL